MIDYGAVATALGTLIATVMTGLVAWKTMKKEGKKETNDFSLTHEAQHFQQEKEWRTDLMEENEKLRARAEKKLNMIEQLLAEKHVLLQTITDQAIKIKELDHLIKHLREIIDTLKGINNDSVRSSEQSPLKITAQQSNNDNPKRT